MHTDIGGGYARGAYDISDLSLAWMVDRCAPFLIFDFDKDGVTDKIAKMLKAIGEGLSNVCLLHSSMLRFSAKLHIQAHPAVKAASSAFDSFLEVRISFLHYKREIQIAD